MTATGCSMNIDHVGLLGPSIHDLVSNYIGLGFSVVGPAELVGVNEAGEQITLDQQSAHIMFAEDYVELTAVAPHAGENHHLARLLNKPAGLRLIVLRTDDIGARWQACTDVGLEPTPPQVAVRDIAYGDNGTAEFCWFALAADRFPQTLVAYVEHRTPEIVFQSVAAEHPNGAIGLSRVIVCAEEMPAQYVALAASGRGTAFEAWPAERLAATFGASCNDSESIAAFGVQVNDCDVVEQTLQSRAIDYRTTDLGITVPPAEAGGAGLIFEEDITEEGEVPK